MKFILFHKTCHNLRDVIDAIVSKSASIALRFIPEGTPLYSRVLNYAWFGVYGD